MLADNPSMNARVDEPALQPLRVVADSRWRTPPDSRILERPEQTLLAGDRGREVPAPLLELGVPTLPLPLAGGSVDLSELLTALARSEVNEVQVEAGARLCGALLSGGLVDELLVYQAPVLLGDGGPGPFRLGPLESMAESTHFKLLELVRFGDDLRIRLYPPQLLPAGQRHPGQRVPRFPQPGRHPPPRPPAVRGCAGCRGWQAPRPRAGCPWH